jgi:hypothetical protein
VENYIFCDDHADRAFEYFSIDVCPRCHVQLGLNRLNNLDAPSDEYMESLVSESERVYVNALNLYASLFPRTLAPDLFGLFFANLDGEEIDDVFIISMITAARAIWLFGTDRKKERKKRNHLRIHALHVFGNLVDIAMMGNIAKINWDSDLSEETNLSISERRIELAVIEILTNLKGYDDGTLQDYIEETILLIGDSERFR